MLLGRPHWALIPYSPGHIWNLVWSALRINIIVSKLHVSCHVGFKKRFIHGTHQRVVNVQFDRLPGFIAVVRFGSFPSPFSSVNSIGATYRRTEKEWQLADGRGVEGGGGRSQIKRRRESLIIYNTLNTLWYTLYRHTYGTGTPLRPIFKAGKIGPFKVKSKVNSSALPITCMYVPVLYSVHSLPTS